jgi:hypothetical protein
MLAKVVGLYIYIYIYHQKKVKQDTILVPALTRVMSLLQDYDYPLLLQAVIFADAPRNIIVDMIIDRFDCTMTRDSSNYLPITVAIYHMLDWEAGMKQPGSNIQ